MPKRKKTEIIFTNEEDKPSRFLVNLNSFIAHENDPEKEVVDKGSLNKLIKRPGKAKSGSRNLYSLKSVRKNISGALLDLKFFGKTAAGSGDVLYTKASVTLKPKPESGFLKRVINSRDKQIKRLAFFPILQALFTITFNIVKYFLVFCFNIGWLAVFLIRFFFLLALSAYKYSVKKISVLTILVSV